MRRVSITASCALLFAIVAPVLPATASPPAYELTDLGTLGGSWAYARAISESGYIAGDSNTSGNLFAPFVWTEQDGITSIGTWPGGDYATAVDVNESGQVAGYGPVAGTQQDHAFIWTASTGKVDLGTLGGDPQLGTDISHAAAINDAGQVVGLSANTSGGSSGFIWSEADGLQEIPPMGGTPSDSRADDVNDLGHVSGWGLAADQEFHAFFWSPQQGVVDIVGPGGAAYDISDQDQVVGEWYDAGGEQGHAFSWTPQGGFVDIPPPAGGTSASANSVSEAGHVVGYMNLPGATHAFLWTATDGLLDLGALGGTSSQAYGVNSAGSVIGTSGVAGGDPHGFLWTDGTMHDLNDLVADTGGLTITIAEGITEDGRIIARGQEADGDERALLLTPISPLEISNVIELADPVGRFERFEADIELNRTYADPFDPSVIKVDVMFTAPSGATSVMPAFWFQDFEVRAYTETNEVYDPVGDPSWRVRFAPAEVGTYTYVVRAVDGSGGSADSAPMTFDATATGNQGFVRVDGTDARFLRFDRGEPYVPLGHNAGFDSNNPPFNGTTYYEVLFDESFAPQENWTRIWMTDFNRSALEWGPGHWSGFYDGVGAYSLPAAWRMDQILGSAQAHGLYVQLVLNDHGQFSSKVGDRWPLRCNDPSDGCTPGELGYDPGNPYSDAVGGPVPADRPDLFFSDPQARDLFERRLRYVVARWGGYTNVLAWELFNEVQFTGSDAHNPYNDPSMWADVLDWHGDMAAYLGSIDPFDHLVTTSSDPAPAGADLGSVAGIDIVQVHDYTPSPDARHVSIAGYVSLLRDRHGKPVIAGEFGLGGSNPEAGFDPMTFGGTAPEREHLSQGTHVHNAVWAGALTASGSMTWWWDNYMAAEPGRNRVAPDFPLAPRVFPAISAYLDGEDWATLGLDRSTLSPSSDLVAVGLDNGERAFLWLRDIENEFGTGARPGNLAGRTISGATVEIPGMADGDYRVRVFGTYGSGGSIGSFPASASAGVLQIEVPNFTRDLALKVRPVDALGITITPATNLSPPDESVTVAVTGFGANVDVLLQECRVVPGEALCGDLATVTTDGDGSFSTPVTISPVDLSAGFFSCEPFCLVRASEVGGLAVADAKYSFRPDLTVNTVADHDDGTCDSDDCTFREAINEANASPGEQFIHFILPSSGPQTLRPTSELPAIAGGGAALDGDTFGGCYGSPGIELNGSLAGPGAVGLRIEHHSTVRGFSVTGWDGAGIVLDVSDTATSVECDYIGIGLDGLTPDGNGVGVHVVTAGNNIGGTSPKERNVISGNADAGILVDGAPNTRIVGNYVGTDASGGTVVGNGGPGIEIRSATGTTIGGTVAGAPNVISGNDGDGISILGSGNSVLVNLIGTDPTGTTAVGNAGAGVHVTGTASTNNEILSNVASANGRGVWIQQAFANLVRDNLVGTDATGTSALGNIDAGVVLSGGARDNTIGGPNPGQGNVISGNEGDGVWISGSGTRDNRVGGNLIGVAADGTGALGNAGSGILVIDSAPHNWIGFHQFGPNTIAHNGGDGVEISPAGATCCPSGIEISRNPIFDNGGLGIDLGSDGVTPNDAGDGDAGPNGLQNFPELTSAHTDGVVTSVDGTLDGPVTSYRVEFFSSPSCVAGTEGETYLGEAILSTSGAFAADVDPTEPGTAVTATAFRFGPEDTSEFSGCVVVEEASGDTTPPTIDLVTPRDLAWYADGDFVQVEFTCQDEAGGSGLDTCVGDLPNGTELDTSTADTYTFEVTATDGAGNSATKTHTYTISEPLFDADTDGDGLLDAWETSGVDVDGDGTVDLHIEQAPFNADPDHKDIFVEVDHMDCAVDGCAGSDTHSHEPQPGALDDVVQAFADAPLGNPDGVDGITLHAMADEAIAEATPVSFITRGPGPSDDFDDLKTGTSAPCDGAFGTAAERADTDCERILAARALVFHYAIFGHAWGEGLANTSSGIGEIFGNDFMVTLGVKSAAWIAAAGSLRNAEAGTFMHELGHNLNLQHGGFDSINCKPNYLSVMNYAFQVPAIDPTRPLDYSRGETEPFLDETFLEEEFGISGPFGRNAIYGVNGEARVAPADGPIDWDDDGDPFGIVSADINWIDSFGSGCNGFGDVLESDSDWDFLAYEFMFFGQVADGVHDSAQELVGQELTAEEAEQTAASVDFDGDGVSNAEDTCPADANDMDGDGTGDACDKENVAIIDIKPGSVDNPIKKGSSGATPVAILSTATFSAPERVAQGSLTFGRFGDEASFKKCDVPADVNGDGRLDLLCQFTTTKTGFQLGDTIGTLRGTTVDGAPFVGTDRVKILKK